MSAPYAAKIQWVNVFDLGLAECGPMAKQDAVFFGLSFGVFEPGQVVFELAAGFAFVDQVEAAFGVAVAHAGEAVADEAQAIPAL